MKQTIEDIVDKLKTLVAERNTHKTNLEKNECLLAENREDCAAALRAQAFLTEVSRECQVKFQKRIAGLTSFSLNSVYDSPPEFIINWEQRRGVTEADLLFKEYGETYVPEDGSGFGAIDVAAFGLLVTGLALNPNRPTLILDEPFKHVSPDLQNRVSELLSTVAKDLNLQIIMVSHAEEINIAADKTFTTSKKEGITRVESK